jgi:hypothetical protein
MGTSAVWIGILVAHLTFSVLSGGTALFLPPSAVDGVFMAAAALIVGLAPAIFIGWGLGMPLGLLLRPVRNQRLHVAAFGALGAAIGLPFGGFADPPMLLAAAGLAVAAALGRLSVWTFVRVYDDVGRPAAGTEVL